MRLFHGTDNAEIERPTVLTLGVFDGPGAAHQKHQGSVQLDVGFQRCRYRERGAYQAISGGKPWWSNPGKGKGPSHFPFSISHLVIFGAHFRVLISLRAGSCDFVDRFSGLEIKERSTKSH